MAKFQEQELFKGAVQSQGFAPSQAPDTSRFLRENMEQVDRNFANLKSQQQAQLDAKLKNQLNTLEMFGQFSKTAREFATTIGAAYIDNQFIEGTAKARAQFDYGVTPEAKAIYDAGKAQTADVDKKLEPVVNDYIKNNESQEAINFLKSLPSYQRMAATEYYLKKKGGEYIGARDAFLQDSSFQLTAVDGTKFSPKDAYGDPAKAGQVLGAFHRKFMAENVGIGKEFNPNPVMMAELYKVMDKADDAFMTDVRNAKTISDSEALRLSARQAYEVDNDLSTFISRNVGLFNPKTGKPMTRREARQIAYQTDLSRYANGEKDVFDKYRTALVDPSVAKDKSFYEQYKNEFTDIGGIEDQMLQIDKKEMQEDDDARRIELKTAEDEIQQYLETSPTGEVDDPEFYIRLRQKLRPRFGDLGSDQIVDRLEKTYRPDLLRDEQMLPMLMEKAAKLELTNEFLDTYQVSANLRGRFADAINKSNSLRAESTKDDEKAVRSAIRNDAKRKPDGTTDPMAVMIEAELVNRYKAGIQKYLDQGLDPANASKEAAKDTIAFYESEADLKKPSGRYYQNPNNGNEFDNYKKALGAQGLKAGNVSKRYNKLEILLKAFDGNWDTLIRSEELLSKNDLQRISTLIESDPFLLSVQKNDPLYVPLVQLKSLLRNNNPNLSLYKVLQRSYDTMNIEAPPALKQIQPSLDQLSPTQTRFINNLLNGSATQTQIRRMTTPASQLALRPSKNDLNPINTSNALQQFRSQVKAKPTFETASGQPGIDVYFEDKQFRAVLPGTVKEVRSQYNPDGSGYGEFIVVESVDPLTNQPVDVLYSHFANAPKFRPGQQIAVGQVLGKQGGTGSVRSVDGTIASIDFLAPAAAGSSSMTPYSNFNRLRHFIVDNIYGAQ